MAESSRDTKEMTFWEHLDEFRKVLFRSIIAIVVLMAVVFVNKRLVFETIIFAPRSSDFILYQWLDSLSRFFGIPSLAPDPFMLELQNIELWHLFWLHLSFYSSYGFLCGRRYTPMKRDLLWVPLAGVLSFFLLAYW